MTPKAPDTKKEAVIMSACLEALSRFIKWGGANYKRAHPKIYSEAMRLIRRGEAELVIRVSESAEKIEIAYCLELVDDDTPKPQPLFFLALAKQGPGSKNSPLH